MRPHTFPRALLPILLLVAAACSKTPADGDAGVPDGAAPDDAGDDDAASAPLPDAAPANRPATAPTPTWDWTGVIGTGQSLAVGEQAPTPILTTQPYNNLKLSLGTLTVNTVADLDPTNASLSMVPLVELIRPRATTYPSAYPANISGETPHTAMADEITSLARAAAANDYVTVHTEVGENGQGIAIIDKAAVEVDTPPMSMGRAYKATLFEVTAIKRLAATKSYGVGAIILTHGEADAGSATYETDIHQLWKDYNDDFAMITGQSAKAVLIVSQQNSVPTNSPSASAQAQWMAGVDYPGDIICSGPKYQYPYATDHVHLIGKGYDQLGEKYGQVYYERVVLGHDWQPLSPTRAVRTGTRVVTVEFHVPVAPLGWDDKLPPAAASPKWANGRGFELTASGATVEIKRVTIAGNTVQIVSATDVPASGVYVAYAWTAAATAPTGGTVRWGQLRDSDPIVGSSTMLAQPNYCVGFQIPVTNL